MERQYYDFEFIDDNNINQILISFNGKRKLYPDGNWKDVICNKSIFSAITKPRENEKSYTMREYLETLDLNEWIAETEKLGYWYDFDGKKQYCRDRTEEILLRAKNKLFDLIACNKWDYFVTITFGDETNRDNVQNAMKKLIIWLSNMVSRKALKYILVPEYHKNGGIHAHMLTNDALNLIDSGTRDVEGYTKPLKIDTIKKYGVEDKIKSIVYNVLDWKYGYSTAIPVYGSNLKMANYITKYLTKDSETIFGRNYWSSRNIQREPKILLFNESDISDIVGKHVKNDFWEIEFVYQSSYAKDEKTNKIIEGINI